MSMMVVPEFQADLCSDLYPPCSTEPTYFPEAQIRNGCVVKKPGTHRRIRTSTPQDFRRRRPRVRIKDIMEELN